jgi:uncharacterized protein YciI
MAHFIVRIEFKAKAGDADLFEQRAFLERITSDGTLLAAAILPDEPGKGIAIIEAPSIEDAKALYAEAPLFKKGIIAWSMSPLTLTYGTALSSKK